MRRWVGNKLKLKIPVINKNRILYNKKTDIKKRVTNKGKIRALHLTQYNVI